MDNSTGAFLLANNTVMVSLISELLVLLPKDQRDLLRTRLLEHTQDVGQIDEYEPEYSRQVASQYAMWDQLLRGPQRG